jgi:hypothetical protein
MQTKLAGLVLAIIGIIVTGGTVQADVVQDWNIEALRVTFTVGPPQARVLAIMHVAMHDAINVVTREYETYAAELAVPPGTSATAAGAPAAHRVLVSLFPGSPMIAFWDQALTNSLAGIPEPARTNGIIVGREVGDLVLDLRSGRSSISLPRRSRLRPRSFESELGRRIGPFHQDVHINLLTGLRLDHKP